jgi:hypothetical protein
MSSTGGSAASDAGSITSPRMARSWATKSDTGAMGRWGASSAHVWWTAATSDSGPIVNRPDPLRRSEQGEAVLGQCRRRPQLPAGLAGRGSAPIAQPEHARPVPVGAAVVDQAHQAVEVDGVDERIEALVVRHAATVTSRPSRRDHHVGHA